MNVDATYDSNGNFAFSLAVTAPGVKATANVKKGGPYGAAFVCYKARKGKTNFVLQATTEDIPGDEPISWNDKRLLWQSQYGVVDYMSPKLTAEVGGLKNTGIEGTVDNYLRFNLYPTTKELIVVDVFGKAS